VAWLIGPFIDAWLKVFPDDRAAARHILDGFEPHLAEAGIGSISEVFDAEPPFTPRGCIAQAWSVAEVLRCLVRTVAEQEMKIPPAAEDLKRFTLVFGCPPDISGCLSFLL